MAYALLAPPEPTNGNNGTSRGSDQPELAAAGSEFSESSEHAEHTEQSELAEIAQPAADAEHLGDSIVELAARIQAATYHLLVMLREFDELEGWDGFPSCAHWLNYRTGLNMGAAREKIRVARALPALPKTSAAMRQGRLSYSKVRALTRVATPRNEERLLNFALIGTAAQTERLVRSWRRVDRILEAERDEYRQESRSVHMFTDEDGMLVINARLDPETGSVFRRAIDAAADRLYDKAPETHEQVRRPNPSILITPTPLEHRRADALALVAESALAADLDPGTRGDRYQVVIHVDEPVLKELGPDQLAIPGMSMLEDAIDVSAETSRRHSCDCATVTMTHDAAGNTLDVGRKTRTISPAMRRALRHRDRTCRFPGCGVTVCEGHHVKHWADGGETKLDNLVLLCRRHHRAVHEEGYSVELLDDGEARFCNSHGREIPQVPPPPDFDCETAWELLDYSEPDGVAINSQTGSATSDSAPVDYGSAISVLYERHEADADDEAAGAGGEDAEGDADTIADAADGGADAASAENADVADAEGDADVGLGADAVGADATGQTTVDVHADSDVVGSVGDVGDVGGVCDVGDSVDDHDLGTTGDIGTEESTSPGICTPGSDSVERLDAGDGDPFQVWAAPDEAGLGVDHDVSAETSSPSFAPYEPVLDWEIAMDLIAAFSDDLTEEARAALYGLEEEPVSLREFCRMWETLLDLSAVDEDDEVNEVDGVGAVDAVDDIDEGGTGSAVGASDDGGDAEKRADSDASAAYPSNRGGANRSRSSGDDDLRTPGATFPRKRGSVV